PFDHRLRILRLEEDASEARHAGPMLPFGHRPGNGTPQYEREVRADAERRAMRWSFSEQPSSPWTAWGDAMETGESQGKVGDVSAVLKEEVTNPRKDTLG